MSMNLFLERLAVTSPPDAACESDHGGDSICLDKTWHGLHYLLTGQAWEGAGPEAFLLLGGVEGDEDFGYGPPRYFSPTDVETISQTLSNIDGDQLWSRFDAAAMTQAGIYPEIWQEEESSLREEYLASYELLRRFVAETAKLNAGMQIVLE